MTAELWVTSLIPSHIHSFSKYLLVLTVIDTRVTEESKTGKTFAVF